MKAKILETINRIESPDKAAMDAALSVENLDFLVISHFVWNDRSRRVIEKCGFSYLRPGQHQTRYGTTEDTLEYILRNPNK